MRAVADYDDDIANMEKKTSLINGNIEEKSGFGDISEYGTKDTVDDASRPEELNAPYKVTRLCALYLAFVASGMSQSLLGATILELQIQTSADLDKLTMLVMWSFFGRMLSAVAASAIFDRFHQEMQFGLCMLACSVLSGLIPLTTHYAVVALLVVAQGFFNGYVATGGGVRCFELMGVGVGPFLQCMYFMYAVGGAVTPPIVKPFLTISEPTNITDEELHQVLNQSDSSNTWHVHPGTFYPYLVLTILFFLIFIYYAILFSMDKCKVLRPKRKSNRQINGELHQNVNKGMLSLFCALIFCSLGMDTTVASLLYAYTVKHLDWDVVTANILFTLFWVTYAIGRAIGIVHARFIHPRNVLTAFFSIQAAAFIAIAAFSHMSRAVMWASVPCVGLAMSTQIASIYQYAGDHVPISGKTLGIIMIFSFSSGIANPALTGYLFKNVHMQWFIYLQLIFMGILIIIFIIIRVWSAKLLKLASKTVLEINVISMDVEEKVALNNKVL